MRLTGHGYPSTSRPREERPLELKSFGALVQHLRGTPFLGDVTHGVRVEAGKPSVTGGPGLQCRLLSLCSVPFRESDGLGVHTVMWAGGGDENKASSERVA